MSMSIHTKKRGQTLSVSFLFSSTGVRMINILEEYLEIVALGKLIATALPASMPKGASEIIKHKMKKPAGDLIAMATLDIDKDVDWEDTKDDFQM